MADKETGNTEPSKAVSSMTNVRIQLLLTHITFTGLVILNSCLINLSFYFGKSEAILALMWKWWWYLQIEEEGKETAQEEAKAGLIEIIVAYPHLLNKVWN
jgi:hypothetical protein